MTPKPPPGAPGPTGQEGAAGQERPGTLRRARAARTEAAFKEAARAVFARKGFINAKIGDIAAEAGRAAGSFYNHFPSKEAVLEALVTDWVDAAGRELTGHGTDHDLSDPEHLRRHVAVVWHTYRAHLPEIRALQEAALVNDAFARRLDALQYAESEVLRQHLADMRSAGAELPGPVDLVASAVLALLNEFSRTWLLSGAAAGGRCPTDEEAVDTLTRFILHGLAGGPGDS
ncbi:TetR/AcrR family transcriptional regulator [Streptomyces sp. NPDC050560]|uniref:TetR/AcrR family transcriptional regulator n=1 Tax=Streptomyces sp. NPDC050560 TaxID=3365630 RepID=UPI0037AC03E7